MARFLNPSDGLLFGRIMQAGPDCRNEKLAIVAPPGRRLRRHKYRKYQV
jgi:hypothetical protein